MSIASLQAEVSRLESINRELRSELYEIESGANRGYNTLEESNSKARQRLDTSSQILLNSQNAGLAAIEKMAEIDRLYTRFKQMELANKRIRDCNNKRFYDFANYRRIRKIVQGLMDNLDVNMVSDAVIYRSIEAQHLKTPNYWLTCALIAIMGWKNDDKELAERALQIAIKLDKKDTAVFFLLFNLRMGRDDAALKWFYSYQECPLKGSDERTFLLFFALMSKTINSSEKMSDESRREMHDFIDKVVALSLNREGYSEEEMVQCVLRYIDQMDSREHASYPLLEKHCGAFPQLQTALCKAKGNVSFLEFLKEVLHFEQVERNSFVKNYILELVERPNDEEKQVSEDIRYNELIIHYEGDVEAAKAQMEAKHQHDEAELNLILEMINWIYRGNKEEVDAQGRLTMFSYTKDLQLKAYERHLNAYRSAIGKPKPIQIGDYATQANLSDPAGEERKIRGFYEQRRDQQLAQIKNLSAYIAFAVALAAAVAAPFLHLAMLIITVIAAGAGGYILLSNKSKRSRISDACENSIQACTEVLNKLIAEFRRYLEEIQHYDSYDEQIREEFDQL